MGLTRYKAKRDFTRTKEPAGGRPSHPTVRQHFVIQKHAARNLHYDFRLEQDAVLKSWAVPKGIPTKKADKRLAMHVEDHPVEYATFEGIIEPGNYGAGSVMVWDRGDYEVLDGSLAQGKLTFRLNGEKLQGDWTLVRMHRDENGKEPWLLIKSGADMKPISKRANDLSAASGRTMKQIASRADNVWESNRPTKPKKGSWRLPVRRQPSQRD